MMIQKLCVYSSLIALTACATAQENPHYKYSSKYGEESQATQLAANSQPSQTVYVSPERRAAQMNNQLANSETERAPGQANVTYANSANSNDMGEQARDVRPSAVGTPGYGVYVPETVENYDYSENVLSANNSVQQDTSKQFEESRALQKPLIGQIDANYIVSSGDTVYNISRRLCVDVEDVQTPNGLGNDFAIDIGQSIYLPPSRC